MKITFKPLTDHAPVRPADMPEGVAFEHTHKGTVRIGARQGHRIYGVDNSGNISDGHYIAILSKNRDVVLRRRDGLPLPNAQPDPVPLDTLEPFPVWYPDERGEFCAHDTTDGYIAEEKYDGEPRVDCLADGAGKVSVIPTPHIMQVEP